MSTIELKEKATSALEHMLLQIVDGYFVPYGQSSGISEAELLTELSTRTDAKRRATQAERAAYLKTKHTRELLKMRHNFYHGWGICDIIKNVIYKISHQEFYDELNTREHVPNKKEAKELRRAAAKRGR